MIFGKITENKASASAGACVSIILSLALIFGGLRLYDITSTSASCQEMADEVALSASSQVAKFYNVANVADTAILGLNITQYSLYAASVVAACAGNIVLCEQLLSSATKIGNTRSNFSKSAIKGLGIYQQTLPALCSYNSYKVAYSNNEQGVKNSAINFLIPENGGSIGYNGENLDEYSEDIEGQMGEVEDLGSQLKDAEKKLNDIKEESYMLDCGYDPNYCMYERAKNLGNLKGDENPYFSSVDTWNYNSAYLRAYKYFQSRSKGENPQLQNTEREKSRSYLRLDYYKYVISKIEDTFKLPKDENDNYGWAEIYHEKDGFRRSERYTEVIYPITENNGKKYMHSNLNMKCAKGAILTGSCKDFDDGGFEQCPNCEFSTNNTGNIGSAVTNTKVGFDYYYHKIKSLKQDYDKECEKVNEMFEKLKNKANETRDKIFSFLSEAAKARIKVTPPGRVGTISILESKSDGNSRFFDNAPFVTSNFDLGSRVAISGAKLQKDDNESGISLVLDRIKPKSSKNATSKFLSSSVEAIEQGGNSAEKSVKKLLEGQNLGKNSGRGERWASSIFDGLGERLGLDPADWSAYKPVLENSSVISHVDNGKFASTFSSISDQLKSTSSPNTDIISALKDYAIDQSKSKLDQSLINIGTFNESDDRGSLIVDFKGIFNDISSSVIEEGIDSIFNNKFLDKGLRTWK